MNPPAPHRFWLSFHPRFSPCLSGLTLLLFASSTDAALYSCTDASGVAVITDSPAQLHGCTLFGSSSPSGPESPKETPTPTPRPSDMTMVPPSSPIEPAVFSVPLERLGSLWVVTVHVNGTRPSKLILDTGASHTILSYAIARDLGLWARASATSLPMHTAGGTVQAAVVPITSLSVGGAEVRNGHVAIYDLPEAPATIDGLLGQDYLHHFEVTLNAEMGELRLRSAK